MGDLIHTLPVISDLRAQFPDAQIDWVSEEAYVDLPRLHPGVNRVIPLAIRRWRKQLLQRATWREIAAFKTDIQTDRYDAILDSQGLLKSAWVCAQARGASCSFDAACIRDRFALPFYDRTLPVPRHYHVIARNRALAGLALGYTPDVKLHYGIRNVDHPLAWLPTEPFAALLVNTARAAKEWAEANWIALGCDLSAQGLRSVLTWGSLAEHARALRLSEQIPGALVAPQLSLLDATAMLSLARIAVGVDTGFTHIANAVETPTIALFCDSDPHHAGVIGDQYTANLGGVQHPPSLDDVLQHTRLGLESAQLP